MRKLLLSFAVLGITAVASVYAGPVYAAPVLRPVLRTTAALDQAAVQTVQFGYDRREYRRRQEIRRREEIRRRRAARHGYYRR